jgi:hypothetical protein
MDERWNLNLIPPKGHADVADFAYQLFEIAKNEKERLGKPASFLNNYALYRGFQGRGQQTGRKGYKQQTQNMTPINLYFANVERTVSVITSRNPTGEVVDLDGANDGSEEILSTQLKKWWKDTEQLAKTRQSARSMEVYGISAEKPFWDKDNLRPDVMVTDPFQLFPAPGYYDDLAIEAPFVCYAYVDFISEIERQFGAKDIAADEAYDLMGSVREEYKSNVNLISHSIGNYADPMTVRKASESGVSKQVERCLVIEVWVRDSREKRQETPIMATDGGEGFLPAVDENGNPLVEVKKVKVYPDGVRKITITKGKDGYVVLDDCANPNINWQEDTEISQTTYPWGRFPVYHVNSYRDLISIWGFSASEQVGDLIMKINQIVNKLMAYVVNVMAPPLIVQQHCGITREMIESSLQKAGRLILMPTTPNAKIEFLQIPNLPATFFQVLDLVTKFFDRIYQIEEADRGVNPTGVIAASAIVALQERNAIVMQAKTSAIDGLAEQRAKWAIGLWQNFGIEQDSVNIGGSTRQFIPSQFAGRRFNYVVESGSTTPRTSLQQQEEAKWLYMNKAIDRRDLLESLRWPNWKQIVERTAEGQLGQAMQILIEAGLPPEVGQQIYQQLMMNQGGPGDANTKVIGNTPQGGQQVAQPPRPTQGV